MQMSISTEVNTMNEQDQEQYSATSTMDYIKAAVPFLQWATAVGVAAWFANNVISALNTWDGE